MNGLTHVYESFHVDWVRRVSGNRTSTCYTGAMQPALSSSPDPEMLARPELPTVTAALEPGLLPVLRVLVGIQALLLLTSLAMLPFVPLIAPLPQEPVRGTVDVVRRIALSNSSLWLPVGLRTLLFGVIAMLYAFWPRLPERLGRWYLPPFLIYLAVAAAVSHAVFTQWTLGFVSAFTGPNSPSIVFFGQENTWSLFVMLLFGVVLMGWQYHMRAVVGYVLLLGVLEALAVSPLLWLEGTPRAPVVMQVLSHVVIYLLVGYIITRMMAAQRSQRQALRTANVELQQYAAAQEQLAISRERNRMARELHDTLAHSLSAVAVQLEAVDSALESDPPSAHIILSKALAQTRSGLMETRRALHALRASPLDDLGLALAVQNLAITTAQRNGMAASVTLPEGVLKLSPAIEQGVYRIAQEALANVARHAGATQIAVTLSNTNGVALTVTDNGRGFDVYNVNGDHMGLQLMRERAEMMGGVLVVRSAPGAGTTVRLTLP
ncbi:MAG TPA: hypothetical protein DCL15_23620 [Chloroflexi bacterium]|nr:hypothetical protein [Chloroflexota bacterium]HHW85220.1 sensor histidine kinase [Chloroflexota bacterium]